MIRAGMREAVVAARFGVSRIRVAAIMRTEREREAVCTAAAS
jgi:hypothetical protein